MPALPFPWSLWQTLLGSLLWLRGLGVGPLEEKLYLYADDVLLYVQDADGSLAAALDLFNEFGHYSVVRINWKKSILFPLDPNARTIAPDRKLVWVEQFKYLGIQVRKNPAGYSDLNILPILTQHKEKCLTWASLPLNLMGRIGLLKMIFLHVFRNCPTWMPNLFFKEVEQCMSNFIWGGTLPRIAYSTLILPVRCGGLALPDLQVYFSAAVLVTVRW